jgi:hypothetical protein
MRTVQLKLVLSPHAREILEWRARGEGQPTARVARTLLENACVRYLDDPAIRRAWATRARATPAQLEGALLAEQPPTAAELHYLAQRLDVAAAQLASAPPGVLAELGGVATTLRGLGDAAGDAALADIEAADEDASAAARYVAIGGPFAPPSPEGRPS